MAFGRIAVCCLLLGVCALGARAEERLEVDDPVDLPEMFEKHNERLLAEERARIKLVDEIIRDLHDPDAATRLEAAKKGNDIVRIRRPLHLKLVTVLGLAAMHDKDTAVRVAAIKSIGSYPFRVRPVAPVLVELVYDENPEVSEAAGMVLAEVKLDPLCDEIPMLVTMMHRLKVEKQFGVWVALSTANEAVVPKMIEFMRAKTGDNAKIGACRVIALMNYREEDRVLGAEALPYLKTLAASENAELAKAAKEAIDAIEKKQGKGDGGQ